MLHHAVKDWKERRGFKDLVVDFVVNKGDVCLA